MLSRWLGVFVTEMEMMGVCPERYVRRCVSPASTGE